MKNIKSVYEDGYNLLLNYVSKEDLERHLNSWEKQLSINGIFEKMLHHGQNRWILPSVINFQNRQPIFKELLFDFSPKKVIEKYSSAQEIQNRFCGLNMNFTKNMNGEAWSNYIETVFESALFLKSFLLQITQR